MTEQPEWLSKYERANGHYPLNEGYDDLWSGFDRVDPRNVLINAQAIEIQDLRDRIARLEAGQRDLEARLGDGE